MKLPLKFLDSSLKEVDPRDRWDYLSGYKTYVVIRKEKDIIRGEVLTNPLIHTLHRSVMASASRWRRKKQVSALNSHSAGLPSPFAYMEECRPRHDGGRHFATFKPHNGYSGRQYNSQ